MTEDAPFSELLRRAQGGDREAQVQLFDRVADESREGSDLLALVRRILPPGDRARDIADSRDLMQTALRSGWIDLSQFRGTTKGEFLAWLRTIARRKVGHKVRKKHERVLPGDDTPDEESKESTPLTQLLRTEVREHVREALSRLPLPQREVMELTLAGNSAPEIAESLGLRADQVRKRRSRAAARLRELLEELGQ